MEEEHPPPSSESRRSAMGLKRTASKRALSATAPSHGGSASSQAAQPSHGVESVSVHKKLEKVAEVDEEEEDNSFDRDDEMSESFPTVDGGSEDDDNEVVEVSKTDTLSLTKKGKRGNKRLKASAGVKLSPSKCKVGRKRADCWKHFIVVPKTEKGPTMTNAKCKSCKKSYVYHEGGSTTRLNRHLKKCTQYLNKVAQAKAELAQGTLNFAADKSGSLVDNPTEYDHDHTKLLVAKMIIVHEYSFRMVEHKWI